MKDSSINECGTLPNASSKSKNVMCAVLDLDLACHIDKMPNMVVCVAAHPLVIFVECVAIDTLWKYLVRSDLRISYHT